MRLIMCAWLFLAGFPLLWASTPLTDALLQNRYKLAVDGSRLSGPGRDVLQRAVSESHFVLVGEAHGSQEIPRFVAGLCAIAAPLGFHTLAIETGPLAAAKLHSWLGRPDRLHEFADFQRQYPLSIPFYNWREENEMLSECAQSIGLHSFHLWGLDQELFGASGMILNDILDAHLEKDAQAEAEHLLTKDKEAEAKANRTGNFHDLFMFSANTADLDKLQDLLSKDGDAKAQSLLAAFMKSRDIYLKNMQGAYYESNRERALLMKANLMHYMAAAAQGSTPPKVIFKFGDFHMYRGRNPMHSDEVGNLVSEIAESRQLQSLHILLVPVAGAQSRLAGVGKPSQPQTFDLKHDKDSDYLFLSPMFDSQVSGAWTMFDLRGLRSGFNSFGVIDKNLERVIFGYDLLVLVPQASASRDIE